MGTQVGIVKTVWAGTTGGGGLTQTAFTEVTGGNLTVGEVQAAVNAVRAFWDSVKLYIPNEVTLTILPTVDMYDSATNTLNGSSTAASAPAVVVGTDTGVYGMASGIKVNLQTNIISYGRRVKGCIYIVPAGQAAYTNTGQVASAAKTAIDAAECNPHHGDEHCRLSRSMLVQGKDCPDDPRGPDPSRCQHQNQRPDCDSAGPARLAFLADSDRIYSCARRFGVLFLTGPSRALGVTCGKAMLCLSRR